MKRSNFLKLIATMVVAPTLMGDVTIKPVKENAADESNFDGDRIRIYSDQVNKCRLGDLIMSDMADAACIVSITHMGKTPYMDARPVQKGKYRFKSLKDFRVFAKAYNESTITQ
jgi:hypothetical protein